MTLVSDRHKDVAALNLLYRCPYSTFVIWYACNQLNIWIKSWPWTMFFN